MQDNSHEKFPLTLCNDVLLMNIRNSDSMKMFEALPSFEAVFKVSKFSNLRNIDCKYYLMDHFQKFQAKNKNNFNIFHSNVNGIESHHDVLHTFLTDFDVLNITETSEKKEGGFMSNVSMEGYESYFTPSNSSRGGTGICVKNAFDSIERTDVNVQHDDFESSWIEIKNKRSKNIICGCISICDTT